MSEHLVNHSELVSQFTNVTGIDADRAKFYLESAAWNLQVALASFYEDDSDVADEIPAVAQSSEFPLQTSRSDITSKATDVTAKSKFGTLSDIQKENSSDEEEGQAFYAGGSERSGQQVIGPGKKKNDIVSEMFKAAKEHGAEVVDRLQDPSTSKSKEVFKGTGYRLGATESDTSVVFESSSSSGFESGESVDVTLRMWRNGFSIDNGALREYQDPANQEFLDSIRRGEIPRELTVEARGREVALNMEDHRHEEFVAPKPSLKLFSGEGHMLGSPVPTVTMQTDNKIATPNTNSASPPMAINEGEPVTNVQIRLADGTRVVARLNEVHTVGDLYRYVTLSRPQYSTVPFTLMTTFPNKELDNKEMTLKQASLLNAVIVQRLK